MLTRWGILETGSPKIAALCSRNKGWKGNVRDLVNSLMVFNPGSR